jgi:hypothetical protein
MAMFDLWLSGMWKTIIWWHGWQWSRPRTLELLRALQASQLQHLLNLDDLVLLPSDVYCYQCDEERNDPELKKHLANWGIEITDQEKTEKTMTELVRSFRLDCLLKLQLLCMIIAIRAQSQV